MVLLQWKHSHLFTTVSVIASFDYESSPILPNDIACFGDEPTLSNCTFTTYDPDKCQQVAGVICEGLFNRSTKEYLKYVFSHHITAPCLSNNVTDCNNCSNAVDCQPLHKAQCSCTSECYKTGVCCPDVAYLHNCLGRTEIKHLNPHT